MRSSFTRRGSGNQIWSGLFILLLGAMSSLPSLAQSSAQQDLSNQFQVRVEKLSLEDLSGSKLVIGVRLAATATRDLTVDRVVFSGLRINGVPIEAAPLEHRFKLRKNASVNVPEPLMVSLDVLELSSLTALRNAIAERRATVEGVAQVRVPLSAFATMIRFSRHADFSTQLHQQVEVSVPGGALGSAALVKVLDLAQSSLDLLELK